ncbi:MAG: phage tail tape measure protein [Nocardioidaceae bacterium]
MAGAAAFYEIIKSTADFDAKMAQVQALTRGSSKEMAALKDAAMTAGHGIAVSATQAADAEIELTKAGISAKDIMGGALRGSLVLAAAGQIDVAKATEIAASAMSQFGLRGKEVPHIADLLAAGADKALGSVADLGVALQSAGTTAHQSGLSIEGTVGVLSEFAAAGQIGQRGGTELRQMLLKLEAPSKKASDAMAQFGLNLYDASGHLKSMPAIAGNLQRAFGNLTPAIRNQAMATIFGSRAVQAANILFQNGAKGTQQWIDKIQIFGFANQQAAGKLNSLSGDLEKLHAAFTNLLIGMGESSTGPLRDLLHTVTGLVDGFNGLPGPIKSGVTILIELATVVGLAGFAYSRFGGRMAAFRTRMTETNMAMTGSQKVMLGARAGAFALGVGLEELAAHSQNAASGMSRFESVAGDTALGMTAGPWGAAIGFAIGALSQLGTTANNAATAEDAVNNSASSVAGTLNQQTGAIGANTKAMIAKALADGGAFDAAQQLGVSTRLATDAAMGNGAAQEALARRLGFSSVQAADSAAAFFKNADSVNASGKAFLSLWTQVKGQSGTLTTSARHITQTKDAQTHLGAATQGTTSAVQRQSEALDKLTKAQNTAAGVALTNFEQQTQLAQAFRDTATAAGKSKDGLDATTTAGLKNRATLSSLADTWNGMTGKVAASAQAYAATRRHMIAAARTMGATKAQADALATRMLNMPSAAIKVQAQQARRELRAVFLDIEAIRSKTVYVDVLHGGVTGGMPRPQPRAAGGYISGPGTGTSDSIPVDLSNGEFVSTAAVTARHRAELEAWNAQGYASGGHVPRPPVEPGRSHGQAHRDGSVHHHGHSVTVNIAPHGNVNTTDIKGLARQVTAEQRKALLIAGSA